MPPSVPEQGFRQVLSALTAAGLRCVDTSRQTVRIAGQLVAFPLRVDDIFVVIDNLPPTLELTNAAREHNGFVVVTVTPRIAQDDPDLLRQRFALASTEQAALRTSKILRTTRTPKPPRRGQRRRDQRRLKLLRLRQPASTLHQLGHPKPNWQSAILAASRCAYQLGL